MADTTITGGTLSGNILPSSSGQNLGSDAQRWSVYGETLDVAGDSSFADALVVAGTLQAGTATVNGNLSVVSTDPGIDGNLSVGGNAVVVGTLAATSVDFSSASLSGDLTLGGNLAVTGTTALTGNVTASGTLGVTGKITANGGVAGALDGTVGATTPNTGAFTTLSAASGKLTIDANGALTKYNNVALDGVGIASIQKVIGLANQGAAITTTNILTSVPAGLYRVSYAHEISQAATTSSATQLTIGWNNGYSALTQTGNNLTGNTLATFDSGEFILHTAAATDITYAATYSSTGATAMKFDLTIRLEKL